MKQHAPHRWEQRGRCVWCADCDVQLYQGRVPRDGDQLKMTEALDALFEVARRHIQSSGVR